jgi:hypothetical protein
MWGYRSVRVGDEEAPSPRTQAQREEEMEEMLAVQDSYQAANAQLLLGEGVQRGGGAFAWCRDIHVPSAWAPRCASELQQLLAVNNVS